MRRPPIRQLVFRGGIEPDRIFHHNLWYRGHTNRRYEELVPRLDRVDAYLLFVPEPRVARAVGSRPLGQSLGARAAVVAAAGRRRRPMLVTERAHLAEADAPT